MALSINEPMADRKGIKECVAYYKNFNKRFGYNIHKSSKYISKNIWGKACISYVYVYHVYL